MRSLLALVVLLFNGIVLAGGTQSAFDAGKSLGQSKTQGIFSGINSGAAESMIPYYGARSTGIDVYTDNVERLKTQGSAQVEYCKSNSHLYLNDRMVKQECEAVKLLARHKNKVSLSKDDEMFKRTKKISGNPDVYFSQQGFGGFGATNQCATKTKTVYDFYKENTCTEIAEVTENQCSVGRIVNSEERNLYRCEETKGVIFQTSCQNQPSVQCNDKKYNLYDMDGSVAGWWTPDGTVLWKSKYGRWRKNEPTPPKYWGKIYIANLIGYFDRYFNIYYDDGVTAFKVASWRDGYALKDLNMKFRGAYYPDGSLYWDGVWGSWRVAKPVKPIYKGSARWTDGLNYDVDWNNYCAGCGGVTLNISGNTWYYTQRYSGYFEINPVKGQINVAGAWHDVYQNNYVPDYNVSVVIIGNTWYYGLYSGAFIPSSLIGWAYYQSQKFEVYSGGYVPATGAYITVSGNSWFLDVTHSGTFTYYPETPPKYPYEISYLGYIFYADHGGHIYNSFDQLVALYTGDTNLLVDLNGIVRGYYTIDGSNGGRMFWDNIEGTWEVETPTPPKFWGSFIAGDQLVNFQQPQNVGMLFNEFGDVQIGRFERLPVCTVENSDGTCADWVKEGTCTVSTGACSSPSDMCKSLQSVCTDTTPCKTINGITACLKNAANIPPNAVRLNNIDCWQYTQKYECLQKTSDKSCSAFTSNQDCQITAQECTQNDSLFYTGCLDTVYSLSCRVPLPVIPSNAQWLGKKIQLISSEYDARDCNQYSVDPSCEMVDDTCVSAQPDHPLPEGIDLAQVAPDGCFKRSKSYYCLTGKRDVSECAQYENDPNCKLKSTSCDSESTFKGVCTALDKTYSCRNEGRSVQVSDCQSQLVCMDGKCFNTIYEADTDFAKAMAMMEAAREAGVYNDNGVIFKGAASKCKIKLSGLTNCCKSSGAGAGMSNAYLSLKLGVKAASLFGSPYMYDALFASDIPWLVEKAIDAWSATAWTSTTSFYGLQFSFSPLTGLQFVGFDPWSFALELGTMILQELLSCDQSEQILAMRKGQNLCHQVGKYCTSKVLEYCIEITESYCCFNSRLARIINEQGRAQIGKGWGSPKSPDCSGFTPEEFSRIDFSKVDLSEFMNEIMANIKIPDVSGLQQNIRDTVQNKVTNYYQRGSQR